MTNLDLVPIWTAILGIGIFLYVLLDGFDLGVGILYGLVDDTKSRNLVMNSIAPVWDGNETWLILGGVGLMAAFPIAFAIIIPGVYFPVTLMLLAMIFRGVSFEFRYRDSENRGLWDYAFCAGSVVATLSQGIILGAFIQGFATDGIAFTGGSFDCFTPFSLLTGVALVLGYALLGSGWLILKTEGELRDFARRQGIRCLIGVLGAILAISVWTPLADPDIARRWFSRPNIFWLAPIPILTAVVAFWSWRALNGHRAADPRDGGDADGNTVNGNSGDGAPFMAAVLLFLLSYLGIAISLWPMIVPHRLTLWQAASPESTQALLLIGTLVLLPVILLYTAWSYWVFRGKVRGDAGYH
jgi:cytochrome d ubiquinol oxidase subunit II